MRRLRLVADADVPLHQLADRLREVGHWVPSGPLEAAIDAVIEATPPALLVAVRAHLRELGSEDGPEERAMFSRVLCLFVDRAPAALARIEAAVDAGDAAAATGPARRLARQAAALGAVPLAQLCTVLADRAGAGDEDVPASTRAALRRELAVTCRVLATLAAELADTRMAEHEPRRDSGA
jgi:HPt (histidine-containing phosphotransfer) domain-containing protein